MALISVNIPARPHELIIEAGALDSLGERARAVAPHSRALLAVDQAIAARHGARARRSLEGSGYEVVEVPLRAEERCKSLDTARHICDTMLGSGLDRGSPVVALGGGIVGDVAGFAAATFMRGVPLIQAPTTLLAMVDAAIGGKTGVNFELPAGRLAKNLIGAFHQPRLIVADPDVLATLDDRQLRCGLAESIKHGLIGDAELLAFIREHHGAIQARDRARLCELIERSARVKVSIVERDEREQGERALLNLGHTFAHAIESAPDLGLLHGEAVAIGLVAASECAVGMKLFSLEEASGVEAIVRQCGLPAALPPGAAMEQLSSAMRFDKKAADGRLRLVLPVSGGGCCVVEGVPVEVIESAWRKVGAT